MRTRCVAAVLLAAMCPPLALAQTNDGRDVVVVPREKPPDFRYGSRLALVVGIDRYESLAELGYAEKDAKDLEAALTRIGFSVTAMRRDTRNSPARAESILAEVSALCAGADPQDTLLIFLSGHGFSAADHTPYFCAEFTDPDNLAVTGLSLEEVRRRLVSSRARQKMLIVDACRNVPAKSPGDRGIQLDFNAEGLGILFSTAPGLRSYEPRGIEQDRRQRQLQNGIFTHFLLRGLEGEADGNGDGWVTFRDLAYHVGKEVKDFTRLKQKPFLLWDGDAQGDIPLCAAPAPAAPEPATSPAPRHEDPPQVPAPRGCRAATNAKLVDGVWDRIVHEASGITLVYLPPGEFTMGSAPTIDYLNTDENPHHRRVRRGFYLGQTEVSVEHWRRFEALSRYSTDAEKGTWADVGCAPLPGEDSRGGVNWQTRFEGGGTWEWNSRASWRNPFPLSTDFRRVDQRPVVMVSWNDAKAFCDFFGFILPTEAQWEWACRAGSPTMFPWGDNENGGHEYANVAGTEVKWNLRNWDPFPFDDGHQIVASVGTYRANTWGLFDMIGNVQEWCLDTYGEAYPDDETDESAFAGGSRRVFRGGGWNSPPKWCRSASRNSADAAARSDEIGFRVAKALR